jgi:hypothetical protein
MLLHQNATFFTTAKVDRIFKFQIKFIPNLKLSAFSTLFLSKKGTCFLFLQPLFTPLKKS